MLRPPDTANPGILNSMATSQLLKDFIEIHESTVEYGSPEMADQLSGAMYMHASIHEDKSSKAKKF